MFLIFFNIFTYLVWTDLDREMLANWRIPSCEGSWKPGRPVTDKCSVSDASGILAQNVSAKHCGITAPLWWVLWIRILLVANWFIPTYRQQKSHYHRNHPQVSHKCPTQVAVVLLWPRPVVVMFATFASSWSSWLPGRDGMKQTALYIWFAAWALEPTITTYYNYIRYYSIYLSIYIYCGFSITYCNYVLVL